MKKLTILVILSIILIYTSQADYYWTRTHIDEEGTELKNVLIVGYICVDNSCQTITGKIWNNQPLDTGDSNTITLDFPPSDKEYFIRYFPPNTRSSYTPPTDFPSSGSYSGTYTFQKKDNCKADFTPEIQSCAEAGLPLSILTDTQLSAETASAFDFSGYYYPSTYYDPDYSGENFDEWIGVDTEMRVDVTPQGSSSSVSGFPSTD